MEKEQLAAEGVWRGLEVWGSRGGMRKGVELGGARDGEHEGKKYFMGGGEQRRFRSGYSGVFNPLGPGRAV